MSDNDLVNAIVQSITVQPTGTQLYVAPSYQALFTEKLREIQQKYAYKWPDLLYLEEDIRYYVPGITTSPAGFTTKAKAWTQYMKDALVITFKNGWTYLVRYVDIFPQSFQFLSKGKLYVERDGYYPKSIQDAYNVFMYLVFPVLESPSVVQIKTIYFADPEFTRYPPIDRATLFRLLSEAILPEPSSGSVQLTAAPKWIWFIAGGIGLLLLVWLLARRE